MSATTPGPWHLRRMDTDHEGYVIEGRDPDYVGAIYVATVESYSQRRCFEDARLIAAAPKIEEQRNELLAALEAILETDERGQGLPYQQAMDNAAVAVAKAKTAR